MHRPALEVTARRISLSLSLLGAACTSTGHGGNNEEKIPPDEWNMPSCPSGDWCGTPDDAEKLVSAEAPPQTLGCPQRLEGLPMEQADALRQESGERFEGMPLFDAMWADLDAAKTQAKIDEGKAAKCCYAWVEACPGGRPLYDGDEVVVADVRAGGAWCAAPRMASELPANQRDALAREWVADARAEHASIASFARFILELMALGAPPRLLSAAAGAAEDEIAHARACLEIAASLGHQFEFGGLPAVSPRPANFVDFAVDTFIEGAVAESHAALLAAMMVERCEDPHARGVWEKIAEDEASHAALAWSTLEWAVEAGGEEVRRALMAAANEIPAPSLGGPGDPSWVALGRPDTEMKSRARDQAWRGLVLPRLRSLTQIACSEPVLTT